jgi:DNA-nicking Smr family endonuclease|tara:strand:+ start:276 stop:686 length:411 start_codon:yes stop_codon:yes gene_type:complete
VKKKDFLSQKDQDDWKNFIENTSRVPDKDKKHHDNIVNKFRFDLHGLTLDQANKKVKEIIQSCSEKNCREILLITGKGLHSNSEDIYKSSDLSKLRFSVPEFIKSDPEISKLVLSIVNPSQKDGGEGALLIKLKKL